MGLGDRKRLLRCMDFLVEWGSADENALILSLQKFVTILKNH